ncbi:BspA family leucine-rich repeat surface protein, partial [Vibrio caribbeanicus]
MFSGATTFNQPIGNWDTSKVSDMAGMFEGAASFNQPIGNWDTSKVTDMRAMFKDAKAFNQPIGHWDISKIENIHSMFTGAYSFSQDLSLWETKGPLRDNTVKCNDKHLHSTFIYLNNTYLVVDNESIRDQAQLDKLEQGQIRFCTSHVTSMYELFKGREHFNAYISDWDTSKVWNMRAMFERAKAFNQDIGG